MAEKTNTSKDVCNPVQNYRKTNLRKERNAFVRLDPAGSKMRHPPPPQELDSYITPDEKLFQIMHMGVAVVDQSSYQLVIDGLVERPYAINLDELKQLPQTSITAFHECYGSPLKPPTENPLRIGNVQWTGVRLSHLLELAEIRSSEDELFIWSDGLDKGSFAGVETDRYQKDLPIAKALKPEVLVVYEINGQLLDKDRGGPVRLVVPGYFSTNSTKWLCRLSVQPRRASGPFTSTFYNEVDPRDPTGERMRPVWNLEVNSMIVRPRPDEVLKTGNVRVMGWAWSDDGVKVVEVSTDDGKSWSEAAIAKRHEYGWQKFEIDMKLPPGRHTVIARATSFSAAQQPLSGRRNHVHCVEFEVRNSG